MIRRNARLIGIWASASLAGTLAFMALSPDARWERQAQTPRHISASVTL